MEINRISGRQLRREEIEKVWIIDRSEVIYHVYYCENGTLELKPEYYEVDGAPIEMLHGPGQAVDRPIQVPFIFGTSGPKGEAVARELGHGVFTPIPTAGFEWSVLLTFGTVLDSNEGYDSPRVIEAAGAGAAVRFHSVWERRRVPGRARVNQLPGGAQWEAALEAIPERERHLAVHQGHLTYLNAIDRKVITGELIREFTFSGEIPALREGLKQLARNGVTEIAYQPAGSDIPRELREFARMAEIGE